MLKREAVAIHGGELGNPSKMPERSTGLDPRGCNVGAKLRKIKGSTCHGCYAFKRNYSRYSLTNRRAWAKRRAGIDQSQWVEAMATLIRGIEAFRWHDAGDVQDFRHLTRIMAVATLTPETRHWLPTREYALITRYRALGGYVPPNMAIRLSAPMVGTVMPERAGPSSMVLANGQETPDGVFKCPASAQGGKCGDCRACWDPNVRVTAYPIH